MNEGQYKIGTVAAMLGVSADLLRAWERRFGLVKPGRQAGKQRLYSEDDVALLRNIVARLAEGMSIGEAVAQGRPKLARVQPRHDKPLTAELRAVLADLAPPFAYAPSQRYAGEALDVSVGALPASDRKTLRRLYSLVKSLYEIWTYMEQRAAADIVWGLLRKLNDAAFLREIEALGAEAPADVTLQAALQDARQSAFPWLLENWRQGAPTGLQLLISLARDHAKIMRNAFFDLDRVLREADEHLKAHELSPILTKLSYLHDAGGVESIVSDFDGYISSRCLETSALDRVLYRWTLRYKQAGQKPVLWVARQPHGLVRFALESDATQAPQPDNDFSSRIVALATGVHPADVSRLGLVGSKILGNRRFNWFHWPEYDPPDGVDRCGCHPLT